MYISGMLSTQSSDNAYIGAVASDQLANDVRKAAEHAGLEACFDDGILHLTCDIRDDLVQVHSGSMVMILWSGRQHRGLRGCDEDDAECRKSILICLAPAGIHGSDVFIHLSSSQLGSGRLIFLSAALFNIILPLPQSFTTTEYFRSPQHGSRSCINWG